MVLRYNVLYYDEKAQTYWGIIQWKPQTECVHFKHITESFHLSPTVEYHHICVEQTNMTEQNKIKSRDSKIKTY